LAKYVIKPAVEAYMRGWPVYAHLKNVPQINCVVALGSMDFSEYLFKYF
jgi:hypothetical protein